MGVKGLQHAAGTNCFWMRHPVASDVEWEWEELRCEAYKLQTGNSEKKKEAR